MQGGGWTDAKTDYELYQYMKNFGNGPPYGTDPLDSWYGKPDYTTTRKDDVDIHQATLAAAFQRAKTYVPPEKTAGGIRKSQFEPAWHVSEAAGNLRQNKVVKGVHRAAPFGVDEDDFPMKYETSASAGPGSWDQSMASRIARRRLTGKQPRSPGPTGGSTAMVAK